MFVHPPAPAYGLFPLAEFPDVGLTELKAVNVKTELLEIINSLQGSIFLYFIIENQEELHLIDNLHWAGFNTDPSLSRPLHVVIPSTQVVQWVRLIEMSEQNQLALCCSLVLCYKITFTYNRIPSCAVAKSRENLTQWWRTELWLK